MNLGLENQVALVAVSSRGLGAATALGFARTGARVVICGRNQASLVAPSRRIAGETGAKVLDGGQYKGAM